MVFFIISNPYITDAVRAALNSLELVQDWDYSTQKNLKNISKEVFNKFHKTAWPLFCFWLCNNMHRYKCVKTYSNGLCILRASSQQWMNAIFMDCLVSKFQFLNEMNSDIAAPASQRKPFRLYTLR